MHTMQGNIPRIRELWLANKTTVTYRACSTTAFKGSQWRLKWVSTITASRAVPCMVISTLLRSHPVTQGRNRDPQTMDQLQLLLRVLGVLPRAKRRLKWQWVRRSAWLLGMFSRTMKSFAGKLLSLTNSWRWSRHGKSSQSYFRSSSSGEVLSSKVY